jgi:hypothetical protein
MFQNLQISGGALSAQMASSSSPVSATAAAATAVAQVWAFWL